MTVSADHMAIGELADRSGVAPSALRFYERQGLIFSQRTGGNQRRYARAMLRRVGVIRAAQALGIPLARIRHALEALPGGRTPTQQDWEALAREWGGELDERIARLQYLKRKLASCIQCACLSLDGCALYNPDDRAGREGPGARALPPLPE